MKKNHYLSILILATIFGYSCKKSETTSNVISYNNFKINSVTLNAFPSTDNGTNWDGTLGIAPDPDIYFNIDSAGTNLYSGTNSYFTDITASSLPMSWPALPSPQIIRSFSAIYSITLYDSDSPISSDDLMGSISLIMNDHKAGYPSSFQISNGTSTVTINGTWY